MGACSFMTIAYGKSLSEAYQNAVDEAIDYYGHDPYNGTISTTYGCRNVYCDLGKGPKWTQTKENKAFKLAGQLIGSMDKRECKGIDLGQVSNRITHHNGWHKYLLFGWAAE